MNIKMITNQSTEKPNINEMRKIGGVVKIWDGNQWQNDKGQFYENCDKCKMLSKDGVEEKCDEHYR